MTRHDGRLMWLIGHLRPIFRSVRQVFGIRRVPSRIELVWSRVSQRMIGQTASGHLTSWRVPRQTYLIAGINL